MATDRNMHYINNRLIDYRSTMINLYGLLLLVVTHGYSEAFFFDSLQCDGRTHYDKLFVCCNYTLYRKTDHSKCCYGEMIDTRTHFCALGKFAKPFSNCNGNYFNNDIQFCCGGKIHDIMDGWKCCSGTQLYDPNVHTCSIFGYLSCNES